MKRVSISQIDSWLTCRLKWSYRYTEGLAKPEQAVYLASGKAIHGTMEAIITGDIAYDMRREKAEVILRENLEWRDDVEEQVAKFLPGTQRAIERMPDWVWEEEWIVEQEVEATYKVCEDSCTNSECEGCIDLCMFGIPDLVAIKEDSIVVGELKSTSNTKKTPMDYLLYNPQHRYYAVILRKLYGDSRPIYVRYGVIHTGKTGSSHTSEWLMKTAILDSAEEHMIDAAREIGELAIAPYYSWTCGFCDYSPLCMADITGAKSKESIKKELFVRRDML